MEAKVPREAKANPKVRRKGNRQEIPSRRSRELSALCGLPLSLTKAVPEEGRRTADQILDALHFLLRDEGAQSAWDKVLPNRLAVCQQRPVYFCPSWLADPCASSVFVVLASVCQHSSYADRYLSLFGFRNDSVDTKVGSSSDSGQSMVDYTNDSDESGIDSGETNHSTALRFPSPAFDVSIHGCFHLTLIACAF